MLQGLVIRRLFIGVDLVLIGAVLAVAGLVVHALFEEASNPLAQPPPALARADDAVRVLRDVGARADYDRILDSKLFGPAGDAIDRSKPPPPPPPPPSPDIEETKLNLELRGTLATYPLDPLASATIRNKDTRSEGVYGLGDEVVPEVTLAKVFPREVLINNRGREERLSMDEDDLGGALTPPPATRAHLARASAASEGNERFSLNKNEFIRELYVNYADLVTKVQPEMYRDASGAIAGITAKNIEEIPLAKTLDLRNGDVLQAINNERIDSQEKILHLINKHRDQTSFRIRILRGGQVVTRTYQLE